MRLRFFFAVGPVELSISPGWLCAADVTIDAGTRISTVADAAFGIHTSIYYNDMGNPSLPSRIIRSGVNTLRYPGGGYADVFHWSVTRPGLGPGNGFGMSPWFGQSGSYGWMGGQTDFGSFISLLSNAQCQAVITVDFGSGLQWNSTHSELVVPSTNASPQEAAAWVAYANANTNIYGTTNDVTIGLDALSNDWRTAGYWAMMRAASPLGTDDVYNFLRIQHPAPVGIQYWEIGNETFGTGYYFEMNMVMLARHGGSPPYPPQMKPPLNNIGNGINVAFVDGRVKWQRLGDLFNVDIWNLGRVPVGGQ